MQIIIILVGSIFASPLNSCLQGKSFWPKHSSELKPREMPTANPSSQRVYRHHQTHVINNVSQFLQYLYFSGTEGQQQAVRELQIIQDLKNMKGVARYDFCVSDEHSIVVAFEALGDDLMRESQRVDKLSLPAKFTLLKDMVTIVAKLHENKIVHGDLRPEVFCFINSNSWEVKLTNFECAGSPGESAPLGMRGFRAPESACAGRKFPRNYALDVWSLGITIIEVLTGQITSYSEIQCDHWAKDADYGKKWHAELAGFAQEGLNVLSQPLIKSFLEFLSIEPAKRPDATKMIEWLKQAEGETKKIAPA